MPPAARPTAAPPWWRRRAVLAASAAIAAAGLGGATWRAAQQRPRPDPSLVPAGAPAPAQLLHHGPPRLIAPYFMGMTYASVPYKPVSLDIDDLSGAQFPLLDIPVNWTYLDEGHRAKLTVLHGTAHEGLEDGRTYHVVSTVAAGQDSTARLALEAGGPPVAITARGSGTHKLLPIEDDLDDMGVGLVRTWDSGPSWAATEPGPGRFDWAYLDAWIGHHAARRRRTLWTMAQVPRWASSQPDVRDGYGNPGGSGMPTDLSTMARLTIALVQRYGADLYGVQAWNEPQFEPVSWNGTHAQLAEATRLMRLALDQVNRDQGTRVKMLGPGFMFFEMLDPPDDQAHTVPYLTAPDGAGGTAARWLDGFCVHPYGTHIGYRRLRDRTALYVHDRYAYLRHKMTAGGLAPDFPLYQTERGFEDVVRRFTDQPPTTLECLRTIAIEVGLGVVATVWYASKFRQFKATADDPDLRARLRDMVQRLGGRTLRYAAINVDGSVTLQVDDGFYTV